MAKIIQGFRNQVREGLMYACTNCRRLRFRNQVREWNNSLQTALEKANKLDNNLFFTCINDKPESLKTNNLYWMCHTCHNYLSKGNVPPMSHNNKLQIFDYKNDEHITEEDDNILKSLSQLEQALVALNIPFQLIYQTPVSRWKGTQGRLTNVPLPADRVMETINLIPRARHAKTIVSVEYKKMKGMKKAEMRERIDPEKLHAVLKIFKTLGNEHYKDIEDNVEVFFDRMRTEDPDFHKQFIADNEDGMDLEQTIDDENEYQLEDVEETCLTCKGTTQHYCRVCEKPVCQLPNCSEQIGDDERRRKHHDGDKRCKKTGRKTISKQQRDEGVAQKKTAEEIEDEEENEFNENDAVQKQKFSAVQEHTMFVNDFPELDVKTIKTTGEDETVDENITVSVAPGENQIPTNIVYEEHWESKSYPGLFPDGKNDFHEKDRKVKISLQQYLNQKILNCNRIFSKNPAYLFAAFACNEKDVLQRNVNIAFKRGKVSGGGMQTLEDPYRVLEKSPGTPIYMRTKKYELIARLENLGPFNLFFTLSCGEKRYNENFTPFFKEIEELKDFEMQYVVENGREEVLIKDGDKWVLMDIFLKENYQSKHEIIRDNVLSQTLTFDHRVQEFIKNIMMNKDSPFSVKYYSYRVEFQLRGAAHCHGTIWVDFEKYFEKEIEEETNGERKYKELVKTTSKNPKILEEVKNENEEIKKNNAELKNYINTKVNIINKVFDKLRNEELGDSSEENSKENEEMIKELQKFADRWTTVSLKNPRTKHLAEQLNCHVCTKKSCNKYSEHCRFRFPRFPTIQTLIAVPAKIKYPDEEEREKEIAWSKQIKEKVRNILENTEIMKTQINSIGKEEIEKYMENEKNISVLEDIIESYIMKKDKLIDTKMKAYTKKLEDDVIALFHANDETYKNYTWSEEAFQESVNKEQDEFKKNIKRRTKLKPFIDLDELNVQILSSSDSDSDYIPDGNMENTSSSDDDEIETKIMDDTDEKKYKVEHLRWLIKKYEELRAHYDIEQIEKERLDKLLEKADILGDGSEEKRANYEKALSLSFGARGYEVILKRDTDELFINNYNTEYLMAWDSNIDMQVCLDYFAIITYILDYKMKDESGTLDKITKALKEDTSDGLRQKLKLVAHTFMTHRRAGESEIMYKLFPFLHLTQSNIGAIWMPTGFSENMSRMMQEISHEQAQHMEEVIQHEGKLLVAKENIYEKYLDRDEKVLCMAYTQFVQRYESCRNPKLEDYNLEEDFYCIKF